MKTLRFPVLIACAGFALAGCAKPVVDDRWALTDPQQCAAQGGTVEKRGMVNAEMCVIRFKEAGKVCSGKADCEGKCLASADIGWRDYPIGTPAKGKCQYENSEFGCYAKVQGGKIVTGFMCTD